MATLVPFRRSIATRLLTITFSIYFLIAAIVTVAHMAFEYDQAKKNILADLKTFQNTFQPILSQMAWSINRDALRKTVEGIAAAPNIAGVRIKAIGVDEVSAGTILDDQGKVVSTNPSSKAVFWGDGSEAASGLFGFEFPIVYQAIDGTQEIVGHGIFYSSRAIVFERVKYGFALIIINSLIKTLALWIIFSWLSNRILRQPLATLTDAVQELDLDKIDDLKIDLGSPRRDELKILEEAFNSMIQKLILARSELQNLNHLLEQKVQQRTGQLQRALQTQQTVSAELIEKSRALNESYQQLEQHSAALLNSHQAMELTLHDLRATQSQLIESEKLASLGQLVAGVAHELNTPIGNALITATALEHAAGEFQTAINQHELRKSTMTSFVTNTMGMTELIARSCKRAAALIASFKQVAIDQTSENRRSFNLFSLSDDIISTLRPSFRKVPWLIQTDIPTSINCDSYPGPLGQVITNLIQNAMTHAFTGRETGILKISARLEAGQVEMLFCDDGIGMPPAVLAHIFEPFYTTRLGQGGSGLGLSISLNIATAILGGNLQVRSEIAQGSCFTLSFPAVAPRREPQVQQLDL